MKTNRLFSTFTYALSALLIGFSTQAIGQSTTIDVDKTSTQLSKKASTLDKDVLKMALTAYNNADKQGLVKKPVLTVIDYSIQSTEPRMWVFDLNKNSVDFYTHVAHGRNTGGLHATQFSNQNGSKQSSLGTFITADTYQGGNGYSLNLQGLDKGLNDNAYARRIVIHGAAYAKESFAKQHGYLGRSWGCPAVSSELAAPVINKIKDGSVVFAYHKNEPKLKQSKLLV